VQTTLPASTNGAVWVSRGHIEQTLLLCTNAKASDLRGGGLMLRTMLLISTFSTFGKNSEMLFICGYWWPAHQPAGWLVTTSFSSEFYRFGCKAFKRLKR
uniref:Uncharacterized protein n=1 Tax=Dicentrarchus labrax TaxID=13489 RepID=A0A8C4IU34_DICLA